MIAFKTWLQAPENPDGVPTEWPWMIEEGVAIDSFEEKIQAGFQVLSESAFEAYKDAHDEAYNSWFSSKAAALAQKARIAEAKRRIEYGLDLLVRFKDRNIADGIQWPQGIHLHSRIRDWEVTFPTTAQFPHPSYSQIGQLVGGQTSRVDIVNVLTVCGDIEIAYFAIMFGQPDSMSSPLHWVTQERMIWLLNDIKQFLGWS